MKKLTLALLAALLFALCTVSPAAAVGIQEYTLEQVHSHAGSPPLQREYEAGETVQLEYYLGTHPRVGGKYYVLTGWREIDVPAGEKPVEVIKTPYTDTLTKCEIAMPARNVRMEGIWEECLVVSYKYDAEGKTKRSYACQAGDKTPQLTDSNGNSVTPERIGHRFIGWSPTPGKTVTKDTVYVAKWEPIVSVDTSDGVMVHFDADYSYFSGVVRVNGRELKLDQDYTAEKGSTIIRLTPEYLASVSADVAQLNLEAEFEVHEDGNPLKLVIPARVPLNTVEADMPETGDSSLMALWIMLLAAAGLCLLRRRSVA